MRRIGSEAGAASRPERWMRWAELIVLFVGVPLVMAYGMEARHFPSVFVALIGISVALLVMTRGFRWRSLIEGGVLAHWRVILLSLFVFAAVIAGAVWWFAPNSFFFLINNNFSIWLTVMIAYPLVLVTGQELIFRSLFFARYAELIGSKAGVYFVNSVLFSLAHLFYHNVISLVLTFLVNFFFVYAYVEKKSFPLAWVLHAISGQLVFTIGLGRYFYHGAAGVAG